MLYDLRLGVLISFNITKMSKELLKLHIASFRDFDFSVVFFHLKKTQKAYSNEDMTRKR